MTSQAQFIFWTPEIGQTIAVGAERTPFELPQLPLPIYAGLPNSSCPDEHLIGRSLYDYLRQFPDCQNNSDYAYLLRDAFPHYIADLASQALMIKGKDVAGPYVGRMIAHLKLLALLEPGNLGLLLQLGIASFDRAMLFEELPACRRHLLDAMKYLQQVCRQEQGNLVAHNYLGQVDYLVGDYPAALIHWRQVLAGLAPGSSSSLLLEKIRQIEAAETPDLPLLDALEAIGEAMVLAADQDWDKALVKMESALSHDGLLQEFASAELHYLHGVCRKQTGDASGALEAFQRSLACDGDYLPAREELGHYSEPGE